nr:hypothetical protein [Tanacetum cinerariifolium]
VLGENYSSTQQVNSIHQLITYSLIIGTKVDIREIIYSDRITKLLKKSKLRYISYLRFISCALEELLGLEYTQDGKFRSLLVILSTNKTMPLPEGPREDKYLEGLNPPADMEPQNPSVANLSKAYVNYQVDETQATRLGYWSLTRNEGKPSDDDAMLEAGDDMDKDTQADEEEHYPELKKYDNILPLTKRQLVKYLKKAFIKGYYEENVDHMEQTDKVIDAAMNSLDKNSITRGDLLNGLNGVTETLKAIQDDIKEDHVLNKKVIEAIEAYTKNSTHLTKLLTLIKNFDFQGLNVSKRYEKIKKIPKELKIKSALPPPILEQAPSKPSGRKRKHVKLEPEIKVPSLDYNKSFPKGVPFVNNMVIEEPEYEIFFTGVLGDQAFQRWSDINKVGIETLVSYLVMTSMIKTLKNARFNLKVKS